METLGDAVGRASASTASSNFTALSSRQKFPYVIVLALTIAGFLLRLLCARGDLWLDEIWSLQNLEHVGRADEIFYAISQDNNHFLNSLWLFFVGPHAPPQIVRLASIVLSSLTIPVAAKLLFRVGRPAAIAAALMTAFGTIFVHYGSEARGYAGFLLMLFLAAEALENLATVPTGIKPRMGFMLAVGFGALFHVAMIEAATILVIATILRVAFRTGSLQQAIATARDLCIAAVLGLLPTLGCILAGALYTHKIQFGTQVPFSWMRLGEGLGALTQATLGFPQGFSALVALVAAAALTIAALCALAPERRILPACAIFLPPLLIILAHAPNVHIPRFHLIAAFGLVLLFAEIIALFWRSGRMAAAVLITALLLAGNAVNLFPLIERGRGDYRSIVARMEADGGGAYASNMSAEVIRTIRFYDSQFGGHLTPEAEADWCTSPPRWYILSDDPASESPIRSFGPAVCATPFVRLLVMLPANLSGLRWALYRRAGT